MHRYSVHQSDSPVRQEHSRRERTTSFSNPRRTPYRHRDSNNDDRGRDGSGLLSLHRTLIAARMIGNNIFRILKTVPSLETGQKKKKYSHLQQNLRPSTCVLHKLAIF